MDQFYELKKQVNYTDTIISGGALIHISKPEPHCVAVATAKIINPISLIIEPCSGPATSKELLGEALLYLKEQVKDGHLSDTISDKYWDIQINDGPEAAEEWLDAFMEWKTFYYKIDANHTNDLVDFIHSFYLPYENYLDTY